MITQKALYKIFKQSIFHYLEQFILWTVSAVTNVSKLEMFQISYIIDYNYLIKKFSNDYLWLITYDKLLLLIYPTLFILSTNMNLYATGNDI